MDILITGSEGRIGKIISRELARYHKLIDIDKKLGIDILTDNLIPYFQNIEILIHLAADSNPFINKKEAKKNIEISKKIIGYCGNSQIKKIINASSINVYPYIGLFRDREKLTNLTLLEANREWSEGWYGKAKIETEKLFKKYCRKKGILLTNLRIGCVTNDNLPPKQENGKIEPVDYEIHLRNEDLLKIINKCLTEKISENYVCVSKRNGFVDDNIRFPLN